MTMEHFFLEDQFYHELGDLIDDLYPEEGDVESLEDDWSIRVQESKLEPIFQLTKPEVAHVILQHVLDIHEDRFSPDDDGRIDDEIKESINECFDVEKFNSLVPKFYYPAGYATITKQDLLDFLND